MRTWVRCPCATLCAALQVGPIHSRPLRSVGRPLRWHAVQGCRKICELRSWGVSVAHHAPTARHCRERISRCGLGPSIPLTLCASYSSRAECCALAMIQVPPIAAESTQTISVHVATLNREVSHQADQSTIITVL